MRGCRTPLVDAANGSVTPGDAGGESESARPIGDDAGDESHGPRGGEDDGEELRDSDGEVNRGGDMESRVDVARL